MRPRIVDPKLQRARSESHAVSCNEVAGLEIGFPVPQEAELVRFHGQPRRPRYPQQLFTRIRDDILVPDQRRGDASFLEDVERHVDEGPP
jgi:hypothetical protein